MRLDRSQPGAPLAYTPGDTRIVTRFLWLPLVLFVRNEPSFDYGPEWRWLERARIMQRYVEAVDIGGAYGEWRDWRFVNR